MQVVELKKQIDEQLSKITTPTARVVVQDFISFRFAEARLFEMADLLTDGTLRGWKPVCLWYDGSWGNDKPINIDMIAKFKRI